MLSGELLKEAKILTTLLIESTDNPVLVDRVIQLGTQLRVRGIGLELTEPDYHKAAKIYTDELIPKVFDSLLLGETNPVNYNQELTNL